MFYQRVQWSVLIVLCQSRTRRCNSISLTSFFVCEQSNMDTVLSPKITFISSQKRRALLALNHYIYKLNKITTTIKYWICSTSTCIAKIDTNLNDELLRTINEHCHPAEKENVDRRAFREKIKQRAIAETTPILRIYDEECSKAMLTAATIAVLPSEREMNSAVNKARRALTPNIPRTQFFDIPDPFTKTLKGNDFLVSDKFIQRRQRMLLFASSDHTEKNIRIWMNPPKGYINLTYTFYGFIMYDKPFHIPFRLINPRRVFHTLHFLNPMGFITLDKPFKSLLFS